MISADDFGLRLKPLLFFACGTGGANIGERPVNTEANTDAEP